MTREDSTLNQGTSALQEQLARVTAELRALEKSGIL
jgi:hypothetical protein